jgi:glycosyltransferase involved in cell wall biosynthesis
MTSIAFVTTCKGRLHHIKQSLPLLIAQGPDEIIVVDYSCPDRVGDWVEEHFPEVRVVRVNDDVGFCVARARNIGASVVRSDCICFIDGDIIISPGFVDWIRKYYRPLFFYRASAVKGIRDRETWGTVICPKRALGLTGGYDQVFRGWGGEDDDLYRRLRLAGFLEANYPSEFVDAIPHLDPERHTFYDVKQKTHHHFVNLYYAAAKAQLMALNNFSPLVPFRLRKYVWLKITRHLQHHDFGRKQKPPDLSFTIRARGWMPKPYKMIKELSLTISVDWSDSTNALHIEDDNKL